MPYKDKEKNKACKTRYRESNREKIRSQALDRYYAETDRERWYNYELKKHYGIDLIEYKDRLEAQNNVCRICGGVNKNGSRLCVDHDHTNGKIRGLLCKRCNTLLGLCGDSVEILMSMISYLREFEE
jgi:hypothetical protein